ncbi:MAG TPA: hypothetical protein VE912_15935, partial [Bacteroidales bacterium]|nr:hypothetical protein [Bacteroidales bacterium]
MTKFKIDIRSLLATFFVVALFTGCQNEYKNIKEPDKTVTISAGDTIADLIRRVTLRDGSFDNIFDHCGAISLKFPYTVQIEDQLVQIKFLNDIEAILQDTAQYEDDFELVFPVTVIYSDYSESILTNEEQLDALQVQYNADTTDDDIECLDFVYPINLCSYNTLFQDANCTTVENDFELYSYFSNLNDLVVEIGYPIQVKTADNSIITINDNIELENQINTYINSCDENDDVDPGDDNDSINSVDDVVSDTLLLTSGYWKITLLTAGTEAPEDTLSISSFLIKFNTDLTVQAVSGSNTIAGTWQFSNN